MKSRPVALRRASAIATVSPMARHMWGRIYATAAFAQIEQGRPGGFWDRASRAVMARPVISLVVTLQMISSLRIFSQVYVMTNGGPAGASASVIAYVFEMGWTKFQLGYAAALSTMLFATIVVVTIVELKLVRASEDY